MAARSFFIAIGTENVNPRAKSRPALCSSLRCCVWLEHRCQGLTLARRHLTRTRRRSQSVRPAVIAASVRYLTQPGLMVPPKTNSGAASFRRGT